LCGVQNVWYQRVSQWADRSYRNIRDATRPIFDQ
jgi:hypothetical protein